MDTTWLAVDFSAGVWNIILLTVHAPDRLAQAVLLLQADKKSAQVLRLQGLRCE